MRTLLACISLLIALQLGAGAQSRQGRNVPPRLSSQQAWAKVQELASRGDQQAQEYVQRVRSFCEKQGLDPSRLIFREVGRSQAIGGVKVWVEGVEPLYLKVLNAQDFDSLEALEAYAESRQKSLKQLLDGGAASVKVAINPSSPLALDGFLEMRDRGLGGFSQLVVEAFRDGERVSSLIFDDRRGPGREILKLEGGYKQVMSRIAAVARETPPFRRDSVGALGPGRVQFKIVFGIGQIQSGYAEELMADERILALDPIDDLEAPFRSRAADVTCSMPNLLKFKNRLSGK